jgi:Domain of unknown function (DUF4294)
MKKCRRTALVYILSFLCFWIAGNQNAFAQQYSPNDTLVVPIIIVGSDTMTYREMEMVFVFGKMTEEQKEKYRKWTRLRNAVYVTYPFAKKAGYIFNDINFKLQNIHDKKKRKAYIKSRESELKKEFADPLTKLSVYQGKVLMKLINRETRNTCFEIIKEYKGGVTANFWQTIAWVFGSSLKQQYNPAGEDEEMEGIVQEVARMYGHS